MPRIYEFDNTASRSSQRYSIPSTGILEAATRGHPHRASKGDLIFVDPKVAHIVEPRRSPSPRRGSTTNNQLVVRQKPRYEYTEIEREVVEPAASRRASNQLALRSRSTQMERELIEPAPSRYSSNQLIVRPRSLSRGRSSFIEGEVKRKVDHGDVVVRAQSRPGKKNSYALIRKPKNSGDKDVYYDSDREYITSRRKSEVIRRRRSYEYDSDSDYDDRRSRVEWDRARVGNIERNQVVSVDELDGYKDHRPNVHRDKSRTRHSTVSRRDRSPDRLTTTSHRTTRRDSRPVFNEPHYDPRRPSVSFAGQETIPRGSVSGSSIAPSHSASNVSRRPPVVTQPIIPPPAPFPGPSFAQRAPSGAARSVEVQPIAVPAGTFAHGVPVQPGPTMRQPTAIPASSVAGRKSVVGSVHSARRSVYA
jgi:hypothetical protein